MKIMIRTLLLVMLMVLAVLLVACSGGDRQTKTTAPASILPAQTESSQQVNTPTAPSPTTPSIDSPTQSHDGSDPNELFMPDSTSGQVVISFDYVKQSGSASNQFAVWIEDMDGNYLQTVFTTRWTANGGFNTRPDSIALWVEKSGIASMPSYYVDAISGATPQTGDVSCVWDLTDIDGNIVPPGEYRLFVEGTLRWKNYVLYSAVIEIGKAPVTVRADAEFVYAGSGNQSALTSDSPENSMIGAVTASFTPRD